MLPYTVIREAAADGRIIAYVSAGVVRGYALFSRRVRTGDISLTHLCVGQQHRDRGIARSLVEAIVERHPQRAGIRLSCRKDYDAHGMWPELGFTKLGERPGRGRAGLPLAVWWRTIAAPSLFDPLPDDEGPRLTIALDGCIAREILQNGKSLDIRALTADWVAHLGEFQDVIEGVSNSLSSNNRRPQAPGLSSLTLIPDSEVRLRSMHKNWNRPSQDSWTLVELRRRLFADSSMVDHLNRWWLSTERMRGWIEIACLTRDEGLLRSKPRLAGKRIPLVGRQSMIDPQIYCCGRQLHGEA